MVVSGEDRPLNQPSFLASIGGCWALVLGGLTLSAAALIAFPVSHLMSSMSFNYSEGWNAYWDAAARFGVPLYSAPPDLNITNYPPISFHLTGLLSHLVGSVNFAGRVIGLFCLSWSAINVATAAASITKSRRCGTYAGLCLILWIELLTPGRIATNDPHFLGLALSTLGLCAYLRAEGRMEWLVVAAVFFVTALFVKNNLLAFPIATGLHLLLTRQMRLLLIFAVAGLASSAPFLTLTFSIDGPYFFAHLLAKRAFSRIDGIENANAFYNYLYDPVIIAIGWLCWSKCRSSQYIALCLACSALLAFVFGFGNGVAYNVHYEALAALAIAVAGALGSVSGSGLRQRHNWIPLAATAVMAAAPALVRMPMELYGTAGRSARLPAREADYIKGVALLKATRGPALCESLLMCFDAEKPFIYDPYYVLDQIRVGRISEARIIADLKARRYAAIEIGEDDAGFTLERGSRLRFSAGFVDALFDNYRVEWKGSAYAILVPQTEP